MRTQFKRSQKCLGIGQNHFMFVKTTESFHHLLKMMLKITFPRVLHVQRPEWMTWMLAVWRPSPVRGRERDSKIGKGQDLFDTLVLSAGWYLRHFVWEQERQTCLFPVLHLTVLGPYSCCPGPYHKVLYGIVLHWRGRKFAPSFSMGYAWVHLIPFLPGRVIPLALQQGTPGGCSEAGSKPPCDI